MSSLTRVDPIAIAEQLAAQFATRAGEADRLGRMPAQDINDLKRSGYLQLTIPREFGGHGLSLHDSVAAQLKLAQGSTSSALVAGMHMHVLGQESEARLWRSAMYAALAEEIVEQNVLINSVASEPALGSPSRGKHFRTTADLAADGTHWIVNGRKTWTTGSYHLDYYLVSLSLPVGTGMIAVPRTSEGIRVEPTWQDALSLRASDSHDVVFEDVRVPKKYLLSTSEDGPAPPNLWFPLVMAATYLGAAVAARHEVIRYALERVPTALGKPIATLPKIQRQIGEVDVQLQAAEALLLKAAGSWSGTGDRQEVLPAIAAAKLFAVQTAQTVTDQILQIAGGASLGANLPLERYFRDTRAGSMHPPSGDAAFEMIGRAAMNLS